MHVNSHTLCMLNQVHAEFNRMLNHVHAELKCMLNQVHAELNCMLNQVHAEHNCMLNQVHVDLEWARICYALIHVQSTCRTRISAHKTCVFEDSEMGDRRYSRYTKLFLAVQCAHFANLLTHVLCVRSNRRSDRVHATCLRLEDHLG